MCSGVHFYVYFVALSILAASRENVSFWRVKQASKVQYNDYLKFGKFLLNIYFMNFLFPNY